jgi:hypothetical protein
VQDSSPAPIPPAPVDSSIFSIERGDTGLLLDSLQSVQDSSPALQSAPHDRDMFVGTSDTELLDSLIAAELGQNAANIEDSAIATPTIDALIEELELTTEDRNSEILLAQAPPSLEVPTSFGELVTEIEPPSTEFDFQQILDLEAIDSGPISSPLQEIVAAQTAEPTDDIPRLPVKKSPFLNLYTVGLLVFVAIGGLSVSAYYLTQPPSPSSTPTSQS